MMPIRLSLTLPLVARRNLATLILAAAALLACFAPPANAHAPGEHYIWLAVDETSLHGKIEISVKDLATIPGVDIDPNIPLTAQMLDANAKVIQVYVRERFGISAAGSTLDVSLIGIKARNFEEGRYAQVDFRAPVDRPAARDLVIRDTMLFAQIPRHRGILLVVEDTTGHKVPGGSIALVFTGNNPEQALDIDAPPGLLTQMQFVWQGALHIWFGFDHVLFLLCLLLTSVLVRRPGDWAPATDFRAALFNVLKIVTLFTVAHSITLLLAALDYAQIPSQFVESVIALSIIVAALSNIIGRYDSKKLLFVLGFGLFHGLGFASVMADLPFRMENILSVVLYFNLGVELGQIAIVVVAFPLLYLARKQSWYVPVVVRGGSILLIIVAAYWLFERVTGSG